MSAPSSQPPAPDVVVVGGGIVGCAVAYSLTARGQRVCLVERGGIATGTSGACMGHLMVTPEPPYFLQLTLASVKLWRDLVAALPAIEFRDTGVLWLAEVGEDLELLDSVEGMFGAAGERVERLDQAELHRREPGLAPDLAGALFYARDGVVMPMIAAGALLTAAKARGCDVRTYTEVTGVRRDAGGAVAAVQTNRGEIPTKAVVNCAGVWSPDVAAAAGLDRPPIFPRRGDLAITTPLGCSVRTQMLEVSYLRTAGGKAKVDPESGAADPGAHAVNVQPQTHDTILVGSTRQFSGYGRQVDRGLLRTSLRRAARFVPSLAQAGIVRTWSGLRPYPRDKFPLVGPLADLPGYYLASGHEGLGITLAPITAEIIAAMICGEEPPLDPTPMSPDRFASAGVAR